MQIFPLNPHLPFPTPEQHAQPPASQQQKQHSSTAAHHTAGKAAAADYQGEHYLKICRSK
jgi:hypothetical protein